MSPKTLLAYFTILATLFFMAVVVALLFLAPDVDPLRAGISFYALTRYGSIIDVAIAVIGLGGIALAFAMWTLTPSTGGRIGLLLLILWGIASILAGAFPVDAPGSEPTLSGTIHNMAGLNFLLVAVAVPLIDRAHAGRAGQSRLQMSARWLSWLVPVSAVLLFTFNGPLYVLGIGGLFQRLYWLVLALWFLLRARDLFVENETWQSHGSFS